MSEETDYMVTQVG